MKRILVVLGLVLFATSISALKAQASLIGHWEFDEVVDNVTPDSGPNARDGSLIGTIEQVPGMIDGALHFSPDSADRPDGVGFHSRVQVCDCLPFDTVFSQFSIALWFKPDTDPGIGSLAGKMGHLPGLRGWQVGFYPEGFGIVYFTDAGGSQEYFTTTPQASFPTDEWTHLAITYRADHSLDLYLDGVRVVQDLAVAAQLNGSNAIALAIAHRGSDLFGGNQFQGSIDDVRIYDHALTESEVAVLAGSGFARMELEEASLKFFHPGMDSFYFSADFDLNENSDGVEPGGEDVTVSFGTYTETLSAGAFDCTGSDCVYESRRGPGISQATISDGFLEFRARRVDLSDTANPVRISVQIGNDSGDTVARLGGHLTLCGRGFEMAFVPTSVMWVYRRRRRPAH